MKRLKQLRFFLKLLLSQVMRNVVGSFQPRATDLLGRETIGSPRGGTAGGTAGRVTFLGLQAREITCGASLVVIAPQASSFCRSCYHNSGLQGLGKCFGAIDFWGFNRVLFVRRVAGGHCTPGLPAFAYLSNNPCENKLIQILWFGPETQKFRDCSTEGWAPNLTLEA